MVKKKKTAGGSAVIYARYSSHNQSEVSIEQQVDACEKYAERNGYTIIDRYADRAVSGRTDRRPAFQKMMKDARSGAFDYVIAWKSNRIGRNMIQAMNTAATLASYGVACLYVEEDFDDTASGRFALRNMMNVNQFYSENMAEDIRRGMLDNAARCRVNSKPPYGYRRGQDGRFEIDEPAAAVVRQIFDRVLTGWSIFDIMTDLNRRGVKTGSGGEWKKQSFGRLLSNDRYTGLYHWDEITVEGGMPVIIDRETFDRVQLILKTKKKPRGKQRMNEEYLLSGKLFCGECGSPMSALSGTGKSGRKFTYYCCNRKRYEKACEKKNVPKDVIEKQVLEYLRSQLMNDAFIDWVVGGYEKVAAEIRADSERLQLDAELKDVSRRIKNMLAAIEMGVVNEATQERMQELLQTRRDLEEAIRLDDAACSIPSSDEVRFWLEGFRSGDFSSRKFQRELITTFVHAVYVYDDRLVLRLNYGQEISLKDEKPPEISDGPGCSRPVSNGAPDASFENTAFMVSFFQVTLPLLKR